MEDDATTAKPTSTPTPCKMGCGFFVSLRYYIVSLFPVLFSPPPQCRAVAESVRPLRFPCHGQAYVEPTQKFRRPGPSSLPLADDGEDDPRRRTCTVHGGRHDGGRFPNSVGRFQSYTGRVRSFPRVSEPIVRTHNMGRIVHGVGRAELSVSPSPLRGIKKVAESDRDRGVSGGALDSIHSFAHFHSRGRRISHHYSSGSKNSHISHP